MGKCETKGKRTARTEEEAGMEYSSSTAGSESKKTRLIGLDFKSTGLLETASSSSFPEIMAPVSPSAEEEELLTRSSSAGDRDDTRSGLSSESSRCSSNDSGEVVKDGLRFIDLKGRSFETEGSTCVHNKLSGEITPNSREFSYEEEMESQEVERGAEAGRNHTPPPSTWRMRIEMPSKEELDAFFGAAERESHKGFMEKYNFDFVNEVPLEGRYQWLRSKP